MIFLAYTLVLIEITQVKMHLCDLLRECCGHLCFSIDTVNKVTKRHCCKTVMYPKESEPILKQIQLAFTQKKVTAKIFTAILC